MSAPAAAFLDSLGEAAKAAAAAETAFRREAAERVRVLEQERAFAFRRLNVMRSVAEAIGRAESEEIAVAGGLAALRTKLGWSEDSEWRSAVLSRFAPVAQAVSKSFRDAEAAPAPDVGGELAGFETWYAETNARSFWALFEQHMTETPVVDF